MDKSLVKFACDGDPSLLVWKVPSSLTSEEFAEVQAFVLPIMSRPGGALYAVPDKVVKSEVLLDEMLRDDPEMIGPSRELFPLSDDG